MYDPTIISSLTTIAVAIISGFFGVYIAKIQVTKPSKPDGPVLVYPEGYIPPQLKSSRFSFIFVFLISAMIGALITIGFIKLFSRSGEMNQQESTQVPILLPITDPSTPALDCRPPGNEPPSISLSLVPRSVRINERAELSIIVNDVENDSYETSAITTQKGRLLEGKKNPYIYQAPGSPGEDTVTVTVREHNCAIQAEIKIVIQP